MIARHSNCDSSQLAQMIADTLSEQQQLEVTQHLDHCDVCQSKMEQLTAEESWWVESKNTLSSLCEQSSLQNVHTEEPTVAGPQTLSTQGRQNTDLNLGDHYDSSQGERSHWVLGLLADSDDPSAIGAVDSMPIYSVIGQGGMGVVLKARDQSLQRYLAIKLLSPMLSSTGAARQRFFREAQSAASVVHPNIVPIYAISGDRSLPYIVMPYIGGGNLQQYLDREGPLSLQRTLSIGLQVAEGLVAAHAQGIIHRDIKPANLMLDEGGFRTMLTDFGLARALDDATLTGSGLIAGTPQYMSPEQACGAVVDARSDLYSLGAVLYALATGRSPVQGESTLDILRRIHDETPRRLTQINESYPTWFEDLVSQLMEKDVNKRVASAEEAAQLLRGSLAHARSPHQVTLPDSLTRTKLAQKQIWFTSIAVLAFTLLGLFAFWPEGKDTDIAKSMQDDSQSVGGSSSRSAGQASEELSDTEEKNPRESPLGATPTDQSLSPNTSDALDNRPNFPPATQPLVNFPPVRPDSALPGDTQWFGLEANKLLDNAQSELDRLRLELGQTTVTPNPHYSGDGE